MAERSMNDKANIWFWAIFLLILGIFIIFIIIIATTYDYSDTWKKETCKANIASLNGQLMRSLAGNESQTEQLEQIFNNYVNASKCDTAYLIS